MTITISNQEPSATYRDPLTCDECGWFLSKRDPTCSQWQEVTVDGNTVTFNRPAAGWRSLEQLIAEHPEAFTFGPQSDDVEYGPKCMFCGNRAAVCRCDQ